MGSKLQEQYMIITDQSVMLTILLVHRSKGQALGVPNLLRNTSDSLATHWQLRMQLLTDSNVFCSKSSERGDAPLKGLYATTEGVGAASARDGRVGEQRRRRESDEATEMATELA
ncbi:hypothetical protein Ac2012v2_006826 [Leucoagaricus gongylophorus]